jgi:hypothetical protein
MKMMHDMELTDDEKMDSLAPIPVPSKPDYPYGLRINLTEAELEKLGLDEDEAEVGAMFHGHFMARVTSVSKNESDGKKCCRIEAQIESLGIESEDAENEAEEDEDE